MTGTQPAVTALDIERTARDVSIAQWGVAGVVMAGSMLFGGYTFHYLHDPAVFGVITALTADTAFAVWLRVASRLRDHDINSIAGWILEGSTLLMALYLAVAAALFRDGADPAVERMNLGIAHAFIPIVAGLLGVAGADARAKLSRARREQTATEAAATEAAARQAQAGHDATQRRLRAEREAERTRADEIRRDEIRAAELAASQRAAEIGAAREAREHEARRAASESAAAREKQDHEVAMAVRLIASQQALAAAWRVCPAPVSRTRTTSRRDTRPAPSPRTTTPPAVTNELLERAKAVRATRLAERKTAGHRVMKRELGIPERLARELVRRLEEPRQLTGERS